MAKDLTEGLVLDLNMETLEDYSGNSNDGTATGTTLTTDKDGNLNKARYGDGVDDNISFPNLGIFGGDYSFTININPSVALNGERVISFRGEKDLILYMSSTGVIAFNVYDGSSSINVSSSVSTSTWSKITVVYNSSSGLVLYKNGLAVDTAGTKIARDLSTTNYLFSDESGNSARYFEGSIFGFRVWNRSLTSEEVLMDYVESKHNYVGLFDGFVAGYDFRGDAKDFSGNGYDGTVSGATLTTDQFGIENSAYDLNGTSNYIDLPSLPLTDSYSITFLFSPDDDTASQYMFDLRTGSGSAGQTMVLAYGITDNKMSFTVQGDVGGLRDFSHSFSSGNLYHVTFNFDGVDGTLIVDGGTPETVSGGYTYTATSNTVRVGARGSTASSYFNGRFYYVLFYNKELSTEEARALYSLFRQQYIYPYPQHRQGGITE